MNGVAKRHLKLRARPASRFSCDRTQKLAIDFSSAGRQLGPAGTGELLLQEEVEIGFAPPGWCRGAAFGSIWSTPRSTALKDFRTAAGPDNPRTDGPRLEGPAAGCRRDRGGWAGETHCQATGLNSFMIRGEVNGESGWWGRATGGPQVIAYWGSLSLDPATQFIDSDTSFSTNRQGCLITEGAADPFLIALTPLVVRRRRAAPAGVSFLACGAGGAASASMAGVSPGNRPLRPWSRKGVLDTKNSPS